MLSKPKLMKKELLYAVIAMILLGSCKKDHSSGNTPPPDGKKYTVTFTVGNIVKLTAAVKKLKVNATNDTLKKYVSKLTYLVYNSSGSLINQAVQDTTTAGFGVISNSFAPGTYTVVFVANTNVNLVGSGTLSTDNFPVNPNIEVFYSKVSITVTSSGITQTVILNRLLTQLRLLSTNNVPANIDSLRVTIPDNNSFLCSTGAPAANSSYMRTITHTFLPAEKGHANFLLPILNYSINTPFTVKVQQYSSGAFSPLITINNVTCLPNQITVLRGNVFASGIPSEPTDFQLTFDPNWNITNGTF